VTGVVVSITGMGWIKRLKAQYQQKNRRFHPNHQPQETLPVKRIELHFTGGELVAGGYEAALNATNEGDEFIDDPYLLCPELDLSSVTICGQCCSSDRRRGATFARISGVRDTLSEVTLVSPGHSSRTRSITCVSA